MLRVELSLSDVLASAITGLLGSFLPERSFIGKSEKMIVYSSSFAAMFANTRVWSPLHFFLVPLLVLLFFVLSEKLFNGFGGKLGTIAFLSVVSYLIIGKIL